MELKDIVREKSLVGIIFDRDNLIEQLSKELVTRAKDLTAKDQEIGKLKDEVAGLRMKNVIPEKNFAEEKGKGKK